MLLTTIVLTTLTAQQGMMPKPAPELRKMAAAIAGTWKGTERMSDMAGGKPTSMKATIICRPTMGGMWLEDTHHSEMPGGGFDGKQLTTYDPQMKKWRAWWFDSMTNYAMEMTGEMNGNTLVMTSAPVPMPGMPGKVIVRSTSTFDGKNKANFKLEMQSEGKWATVITGAYTRVGPARGRSTTIVK